MTILSEEELNEIVDVVCMTVLDMPVVPGGEKDLHDGEYRTARIGISGAWNGWVNVRVSLPLLRHAASRVFSVDESDVQEQDCVDTLTELTNMLGGTVKCMLPETCDLSLPEMLPSARRGRERLAWSFFHCESLPLAVAVVEDVNSARAA